jgi:hypothetical protein
MYYSVFLVQLLMKEAEKDHFEQYCIVLNVKSEDANMI